MKLKFYIMKDKRDKVYLLHIKENILLLEKFLGKITKDDFLKNQEKQASVVRQLEVIGEAVRNVSPEFRRKHKEVAWQDIAGMRSKLIHEYFQVDLNVVWNVCKKDIPVLKDQIKKILSMLPSTK